jgi:hypothetical protein
MEENAHEQWTRLPAAKKKERRALQMPPELRRRHIHQCVGQVIKAFKTHMITDDQGLRASHCYPASDVNRLSHAELSVSVIQ